jgi:probable F420-dependent oxidoreductase
MARLRIGFIPIEGGHYYKESLEEVTRAEELGFDSVWMEEHHSVANHYWPSPLAVLAGFATRTSRVRLGTDIAVAAFHHPVRLAEDVAMLDVMSGGRVTLGVAIGYKPDEFALYGVPLEKRGARFEEQLAIMKGLWSGERVSFRGTYYTVEGRLEPTPVQRPHPPLWIGGWGDITLRRAAALADNWIPGPTADLARLLQGKRRFLENRRAAGRTEPVTEWPLTRDLIIADTDKRARELAEEHIMVAYRREYAGGWRHPFIDASIATDLERLMEDRFIIGGPDQCIPKIRRFVEEYGMTHLICRTFFPGMPHAHIMRELELLAKEVLPAFVTI